MTTRLLLECGCGHIAPEDEWEESDVCCEMCGGHPQYKCPSCGKWNDPYYDSDFKEHQPERKCARCGKKLTTEKPEHIWCHHCQVWGCEDDL